MTEGSPPSATSAAASAVVPAAIAVAHGIAASSRLHWSSAAGCERTTRICSSGTFSSPTRQCRICSTVSSADRQRRRLEQIVGLRDRAGDRALDREHAERDLADGGGLRDRREARQREELPEREELLGRGRPVGAVAPRIGNGDGAAHADRQSQ